VTGVNDVLTVNGGSHSLHLITVAADESLDAISGHFRIFQLRGGHRFSTDDVLTAWYGTTWVPAASTLHSNGDGRKRNKSGDGRKTKKGRRKKIK